MSISTITIGSRSIDVITVPVSPGMAMVEFSMADKVGVVDYPFAGIAQTQTWPGADRLSGTMTLPKLTEAQAGPWRAFLGQLRGMRCGMLLGNPSRPSVSALTPYVDGSVSTNNAVGAEELYTKGWPASTGDLLMPGDYLEVGFRLYMVLDTVVSDSSGNAQVQIWPSVREQPADSAVIFLTNPRGLFRLAKNVRGWSSTRVISNISFPIVELR